MIAHLIIGMLALQTPAAAARLRARRRHADLPSTAPHADRRIRSSAPSRPGMTAVGIPIDRNDRREILREAASAIGRRGRGENALLLQLFDYSATGSQGDVSPPSRRRVDARFTTNDAIAKSSAAGASGSRHQVVTTRQPQGRRCSSALRRTAAPTPREISPLGERAAEGRAESRASPKRSDAICAMRRSADRTPT